MIDHLTTRRHAAGSRTRVPALQVHASLVQWTITVNDTFRTTGWRVSDVTRGTRTNRLSTEILAPAIRTAG